MPDLKTEFCGVTFPTPLIQVSGMIHSAQALSILAKEQGVGGVTWKSVSLKPRPGHPTPVVVPYQAGFINSVGLKNPGVEQAVKDIPLVKSQIKVPLIVSIVAFQISEFYPLAKAIAEVKPDFIEVNLSCPNVDDEGGKPYGTDPLMSMLAIQEVKRAVGNVPVIAKLTPNVADLVEIAQAVEEAGADAIAAINTAGPGLLIDTHTRKARLGHKVGGISGRAIQALALRCVYDIVQTVKIPVIGMGGVSSGQDALAMVIAGATLVGVGSAMFGVGNKIFGKIYSELLSEMEKEHMKDLDSVRNTVV